MITIFWATSISAPWILRNSLRGHFRPDVRRRWAQGKLDEGRPDYATFVVSMSHLLSLLHKNVPAWLKEMGTEHVYQELRARIATALYCQMDKRAYHMFPYFVGCSQAGKSSLHIWTALATCRSYSRHSLIIPLWHKRCYCQRLSRCSFTFMQLYSSNIVMDPARVDCTQQ